MIHVLCLNPAIDKLFEIDGFTAGEDYPGQTPRVAVGGKGVNVARVLSQLGEDVRLYAFLGEDGGEAVRREMTSRCSCVFVPVPGACRTTSQLFAPGIQRCASAGSGTDARAAFSSATVRHETSSVLNVGRAAPFATAFSSR